MKYGLDSVLISNGVVVRNLPTTTGALQQFSLESGRYVLNVGRFVPEKRQMDLIQSFTAANLPQWKLVLVGTLDHRDSYAQSILSAAEKTPNVVLTGFQTGTPLQELYAHAGLFVLPSSASGLLPVSLIMVLRLAVAGRRSLPAACRLSRGPTPVRAAFRALYPMQFVSHVYLA